MSLRFIQINENRALLASTELNKSLREYVNSIALVTEPYVLFDKIASLPPNFKTLTLEQQ